MLNRGAVHVSVPSQRLACGGLLALRFVRGTLLAFRWLALALAAAHLSQLHMRYSLAKSRLRKGLRGSRVISSAYLSSDGKNILKCGFRRKTLLLIVPLLAHGSKAIREKGKAVRGHSSQLY